MGAPYSRDLRLGVLAALDEGLSKTEVHRQFKISRSTVDDWLKLRAETGKVTANTDYYRGRPAVLGNTAEVRAFTAAQQHRALTEMAAAWQQEQGARLSTMAFSRALKRLGYTRKRRAISTGSAHQQHGKPSSRS